MLNLTSNFFFFEEEEKAKSIKFPVPRFNLLSFFPDRVSIEKRIFFLLFYFNVEINTYIHTQFLHFLQLEKFVAIIIIDTNFFFSRKRDINKVQ